MTEEERQILFSLASTMEMTRAELDALRTVFIGTINALSANPGLHPALVAALTASINADTAISLGSPMSDLMLEKRSAWLARLIPAPLLAAIHQ